MIVNGARLYKKESEVDTRPRTLFLFNRDAGSFAWCLASDLAQGADAVGAKILRNQPALLQHLDLLYIKIPTATSGLLGPRAIVAVLGIALAIFTSCRHGLIPLHSGVRQHQLLL